MEMSRSIGIGALVALIFLVYVTLGTWRDASYGGPHHDEVIALLASNNGEREFGALLGAAGAPLNQIVPASTWQTWISDFRPLSYRDIRQDTQARDKHPALAFFLFNRWLSATDGGYLEARILTQLQVALLGVFLGWLLHRWTKSTSIPVAGVGLFLLSESALFTSVWVRQYALWAVCFAITFLAAGELLRSTRIRSSCGWAVLLGCGALMGMSTQYTFFTVAGPLIATTIAVLFAQRRRVVLGFLVSTLASCGALFFLLNPGVLGHVSVVSDGIERVPSPVTAVGGVGKVLLPLPSGWSLIHQVVGCLTLVAVFAATLFVIRRRTGSQNYLWIPLAAMIGGGVVQFMLVAAGLFVPWATGQNHMLPFAFTVVVVWCLLPTAIHSLKNPAPYAKSWWFATAAALILMPLSQAAYCFNAQRKRPLTFQGHFERIRPDLIVCDHVTRGALLETAAACDPQQPVWFGETELWVAFAQTTGVKDKRSVLYLPFEEGKRARLPTVIPSLSASGWKVQPLSVLHAGHFDAIHLTR